MKEKNKMRKTIRERKFLKLDKRASLLRFKSEISKIGLLATIKSKMRKFLKQAKTTVEHPLMDYGNFLVI